MARREAGRRAVRLEGDGRVQRIVLDNDERVSMDYTPGVVAMANAGPNTNGSQFFIVQGDGARALPRNYTIFAHVTSGMEISTGRRWAFSSARMRRASRISEA